MRWYVVEECSAGTIYKTRQDESYPVATVYDGNKVSWSVYGRNGDDKIDGGVCKNATAAQRKAENVLGGVVNGGR